MRNKPNQGHVYQPCERWDAFLDDGRNYGGGDLQTDRNKNGGIVSLSIKQLAYFRMKGHGTHMGAGNSRGKGVG